MTDTATPEHGDHEHGDHEHGDHEHGDHEHDEDGYQGPAELVAGERTVPVRVLLRGYFQPIDGRYHWYGRIEANAEVDELTSGGVRSAVLRTPHGEATGALSDQDPWQRFRIAGTSTPPFPVTEVV